MARQDNIEIFPVPDLFFEGGPNFRTYLAENYDPSAVDHALTIVVGLTKYPEAELISALSKHGFSVVRTLGKVFHLKADTPEGPLETYLTVEPDSGVVVFYTNFRKTEEVPKIKDFLYSDPKSYPLFLRPFVMQQVLNELSERYDDLEIVDFTATRYPGSKLAARIRPKEKRVFSFWGSDGRETLRELEYQYGVLPRRLVIDIPGAVKFGIDSRGFFTLSRGKLDILLGIMGRAIDESRKAMEAFNGCSFQVTSVRTTERSFQIPTSTPVRIQLRRRLAYAEVEDIQNQLDEHGYAILSFSAEEGSVFLSSDVIANSGHRFRIKADEQRVRMLPHGEPNFAAFMEFYEFVLNSIDPEAELVV